MGSSSSVATPMAVGSGSADKSAQWDNAHVFCAGDYRGNKISFNALNDEFFPLSPPIVLREILHLSCCHCRGSVTNGRHWCRVRLSMKHGHWHVIRSFQDYFKHSPGMIIYNLNLKELIMLHGLFKGQWAVIIVYTRGRTYVQHRLLYQVLTHAVIVVSDGMKTVLIDVR